MSSNPSFSELKVHFTAFLDTKRGGEYDLQLRDLAKTTDGKKSQRLLISVNDIRQFDADLATRLLRLPLEILAPWTEAVSDRLKQYIDGKVSLENDKTLIARTHIGFVGAFGSHHMSPRGLRASQLGALVCIEGVVTRCSLSQPKVVRSVHWCAATQEHTIREYCDSTALDLSASPAGSVDKNSNVHQSAASYPTCDADGNALETEFGLSVYKDHQCITIQESPERAPLGQLPRSVDVFLDDDLVDTVKPGDRVRCAGVYRALAHNGKISSGVFRTVILANSLATHGHDSATSTLTLGDVANIRAVAAQFEHTSSRVARFRTSLTGFGSTLYALGSAFAPSIYGHDVIKRALILQLVGGTEKTLHNGSRLRGDINVLLVGDPSTAKSQLLRAAMRVAPLAVSTTGRGSSGVGLTAAIAHDPETGDRRLEAGAVVLADRGLVCIDEFDKMSAGDRVAIHEVMEQQTVTLAKAGIHASLNARCAVLAAANPVYGQYDTDRRPQENVGLPDSLLSRFDLLFIVLDDIDTESDRHVADHVLNSHKYRRPGQDMAPEPLDANLHRTFDTVSGDNAGHVEHSPDKPRNVLPMSTDEDETSSIWQTQSQLQQSGVGQPLDRPMERSCLPVPEEDDVIGLQVSPPAYDAILHFDFVRKYVNYARHQLEPKLGDDARESIASAYADLRTKADDRTLPVTARCLESLIRIATAHAKVRLASLIESRDCQAALKFLSFALYGDLQLDDVQSKPGHVRETVTKRVFVTQHGDTHENKLTELSNRIHSNRYKLILDAYANLASNQHTQEKVHITQLLSAANSLVMGHDPLFDLDEVEVMLRKLQTENRLMYDESNRDVHFL